MNILNKLRFLLFFILFMTSNTFCQNTNLKFNNTFGILLKTGPAISIFEKNFLDGFNLFPTAREDGFGFLYGHDNFSFNISFTKKVFEEGPIDLYGWGSEKLADKQTITFWGHGFELIYGFKIAYLNAGIDFYNIEEKYIGIAEDYSDSFDNKKTNNKVGGHLGFGIKYDHLVSRFLLQPFLGFNYFYINGTYDGIRSDYYLRGGIKIDFGIIIGFKV